MTFNNSDRNSDSQGLQYSLSDEKTTETSAEFGDREVDYNSQLTTVSSDLEDIKISLLEEKLKVTRRKQKVGEIVVRKEIETKVVKIPIRREKLIVERVGENPEKLAEEIINQEQVNGFAYDELSEDSSQLHSVCSKYISLEKAQSLLADVSRLSTTDLPKIRIEIVSKNSDLQQQYRDISDRY